MHIQNICINISIYIEYILNIHIQRIKGTYIQTIKYLLDYFFQIIKGKYAKNNQNNYTNKESQQNPAKHTHTHIHTQLNGNSRTEQYNT